MEYYTLNIVLWNVYEVPWLDKIINIILHLILIMKISPKTPLGKSGRTSCQKNKVIVQL